MLLRYNEDYSTVALSEDLKQEALKELIHVAREQCIKDIMMYRDVKEDTWSAAKIRSIINERICADVQNPIIKMEVDAVHDEWAYGPGGKEALPADAHGQAPDEWEASLGYGPTQGAVGKSGKGGDKGKGAGDKDKDYAKDWKGGDKGKGLGAGKGERPVGLAPIAGALGITIGRARFAWDLKPRRKPKKSCWLKAEKNIGPKVVERRVKERAKVRDMARMELMVSMARTTLGKETL